MKIIHQDTIGIISLSILPNKDKSYLSKGPSGLESTFCGRETIFLSIPVPTRNLATSSLEIVYFSCT